MKFTEGKNYIYPDHGKAHLDKKTEDPRLGTMLHFTCEYPKRPDLTITIPEASAKERGIRKPIPASEASEVLEVISAVSESDGKLLWSRFVKNCEDAIHSADIWLIAKAYRQLNVKHLRRGKISMKESDLKVAAEDFLTGELSLSLKRSQNTLRKEIRKRCGCEELYKETK